MDKYQLASFLTNGIFKYRLMAGYDPHGDCYAEKIRVSSDNDLTKFTYESMEGDTLIIAYNDNNVFIEESVEEERNMTNILSGRNKDVIFSNEIISDLDNLLGDLSTYGTVFYRYLDNGSILMDYIKLK